jgi:hypothetical protein
LLSDCCQLRNIPSINTLKLLYKGLELLGGPSILLGMPKGGLARACLPAFTDVLHALLSLCCCPPECVVVCCYPPALLSGFAVNLNLVCVISCLYAQPRGS